MSTVGVNHIRALLGVLLILSLPAFLAPSVGKAMTALASDVNPGSPYLLWISPGLLYGLMPICVLGTIVLVMSPGLLATLLIAPVHSLEDWLLKGIAVTMAVVSTSAALVQTLMGRPLTGSAFVIVVLFMTVVAGLMLHRRVARGYQVVSPVFERPSIFVLTSLIVIPLTFLILLTPKFFWEAFNGDGAHGLEAARLLLYQGLPFWPAAAGDVAAFPGMNDLAVIYPSSWFLRLFGETEAAVRIPLVLCMPLLFAAIVSATTQKNGRGLPKSSLALIWGAVVSFELVMCYSATYNPYSADVSMPAVMDTLVMVFYMGAVAAFVRREIGWICAFAMLALLSSPASLVLFGFTLLGLLASERPRPYRLVVTYAIGLAGCLLVMSLSSMFLSAVGLPSPGGEHSPFTLLKKFADIALADFHRIGWAALPCGIYPVIGLFGWKRSDQITRALIITASAVFGLYYFMGSVSLHYFVPVMMIPVVIFWRQHPEAFGHIPILACALGVGLSVWFSLPSTKSIYTASRTVGGEIEVLGFTGYSNMDPRIFAASERLTKLFPTDGHPDVPEHAYGESPLPLLYYAMRAENNKSKVYGLASPDSPRPRHADEIYRDDGAAIFVYDAVQWQKDRNLKPQVSKGKSVFTVPRNMLFYRGADSQRLGFFSPGRWLVGRLDLEK